MRLVFAIPFLCFCTFSSAQNAKTYLDLSMVKAKLDLSFGLDVPFYYSTQFIDSSPVQRIHAVPEYEFRLAVDIELNNRLFLAPLIGFNYSYRHTHRETGLRMTTSGYEEVTYFLTSGSVGFNVGIQGKWIFRAWHKNSMLLEVSTYYSHLVSQTHRASVYTVNKPVFDGRTRSILQGRAVIGYARQLNNVFSIQPFWGISYHVQLVRPHSSMANILPISSVIGVAFVFRKKPQE